MGSGSLAPRSNHRTGEGQTGKGGRAPTRNFAAPRSKVFLVKVGALGTVRFRKADRPPMLMHGSLSGRTSAPASEANLKIMIHSLAANMDHESNQANRAISTSQLNASPRSEEHTSELQSRQYLVCRLLLEKKKNIAHITDG